jgi:hypothetical protein
MDPCTYREVLVEEGSTMTQLETMMEGSSDHTGEASRPPDTNEHRIIQFLREVLEPNTAVELRAFEIMGGGTFTRLYSTDQLDELAHDALALSGRCKGVYFTLNPLALPVLSEGRSANANDVLRRRWLLIDADPRRPGKVSSTDSEKAAARFMIEMVRAELRSRGWPEPIVCDSGNGFHLLYRIDLPTEDGGLVRRLLHAISRSSDTEAVQIDRKVHDPIRICKLPGTIAAKGENTPKRPHRLACVVQMPAELVPVTREQLEAVAGPEKTTSHQPGKRSDRRPVVPPQYVERVAGWARGYLRKRRPAIEGQGGDHDTFTVICILENDFALPFEAAWPILLEWNARCDPPWDEDELVRKWEYAVRTSKGPRGAKIQVPYIQRALKVQEDGEKNSPD